MRDKVDTSQLMTNSYINRFAMIADDLTGSNDCGMQLRKRGLPNVIVLYKDYSIDALKYETIVINSETRNIPKEIAHEKMTSIGECVKECANNHILFKRIDSMLRGNIGSELKALDDVLNPEMIVFAPASPQNKIATVYGIQCLNGIPIDKTETAKKHENFASTSNILELLNRDSGMRFHHISIETVREDNLSTITQGSKFKNILFDAVEVKDLNIIISHIVSLNKRVLWVGSAGLAEVLIDYFSNEISSSRPALAVVGSINSISAVQTQKALDCKAVAGVELNIERVVLEPEEELRRLLRIVISKMDKGFDILLASALDSNQIIAASSIGKKMGISLNEISDKIADFLGAITYEIIKLRRISGLFLTGAGTAINIIERLSAKGSIVLEELESGISAASLIGGPFEGLKFITKPGTYGDSDIILNAINYLRKRR